MKSISSLLGFAALLFLFSCSSEDDNPGSSEGAASGKINGVDWEFDVGTAFLEEIDQKYTINLLGKEEGATDNGCSILFPGEEYVRFTVNAAVGSYPLPFEINSQGVKFYPDQSVGGFELATGGSVEITEITDSQVVGRLEATLNDDNNVSGTFTVTICN